MSVVKKAFKAIGLASDAPRIEAKVPAQQLERKPETEAEDIQIGAGDDDDATASAKGKRGLVRPVASSLKV